jgi:hypothetical protein
MLGEETNNKLQQWSIKGINIVRDLWVKETWDWISLSNFCFWINSHHLGPFWQSLLDSIPWLVESGIFLEASQWLALDDPNMLQDNLPELLQPHFGQVWEVWGWSPTLGKVGGCESSGTPECSELDSKGKNTSHWGVLGVIRKVLKRRYRKCPRIGNSDICSPSYGQKKGRESNW